MVGVAYCHECGKIIGKARNVTDARRMAVLHMGLTPHIMVFGYSPKKFDEIAKEGMVKVKQYERNKPVLIPRWCNCKTDMQKQSTFHNNGACSCGVYMHHYHCPKCGGITQVG